MRYGGGWIGAVWMMLALGAGGCVNARLDPETALRSRLELFWSAREAGRQTVMVAGEKRTLYDEFLYAEGKRTITESVFAKRTSMRVRHVGIVEIRFLESDGGRPVRATVTVSFEAPAKFGAWFKGIRVKQDWVLENGKWMLVMDVKQNPFRRKLL